MKKLSSCDLKHAKPEEMGVSSDEITAFLTELEEKKLKLHSFTFVVHDKIISQGFYKPYDKDTPHVLYSMSKAVTSMALGYALDEGLLSLDDSVSKFFPEMRIANTPNNQKVTVRSLATMQTDKLITVLDEKGKTDWAEHFFKAPFLMIPNTKFNYISENISLLSEIITKVTGMDLLDYLYPRIFEPLGIEKPFWEHDGKGNCAGGWGLYMKNEDIAKFFLPYIHDGKWIDGTQIMPAWWVAEAADQQIKTLKHGSIDNTSGYGYLFWKCRTADTFRAYGLFGQQCIMFPKKDALVVMNAGEAFDYEILDIFFKHFPKAFGENKLEKNPAAYKRMNEKINSLHVIPDLKPTRRNKVIEQWIDGRTIKCKTNEFTSVLTVSITQMLYNKPGKINAFRFSFSDDGMKFYWKEKDYENEIDVGMDGEYRMSVIKLADLTFHAYSKASWRKDGSLDVWILPTETTHVRQFNFTFNDDGTVKIKNDMCPDLDDLLCYYLDFMGFTIVHKKPVEKLGRFIAKGIIAKFAEPNIKGRFID